MSRTILLAALLLGTFVSGWLLSPSLKVERQSPEREADPNPRGGRFMTVCFGHVDPEAGVVALSPAQPGRVTVVFARENQRVREGEGLLQLEETLARLRLEEARASLLAAEARLEQATRLPDEHRLQLAQQQSAVQAASERLAGARSVYDHKKSLHTIEYVSDKELAAAGDQVEELRALHEAAQHKFEELRLHDPGAQVRLVRAEVSLMRSRRDQASEALEECRLKAPRAGTVLRVLVGVGDWTGGPPRGAAVQFWPADQPLVIRAEVDQEFGRVAEGDEATVEDYYDPFGFRGTGRVQRVSRWYTQRRAFVDDLWQSRDVRTLECLVGDLKADSDRPSVPLRVGQRMRLKIMGHP